MQKLTEGMAADNVWSVYGSFGMANGKVTVMGEKAVTEGEEYEIESERKSFEHGVIRQNGKIVNTSEKEISVNYLMSKFVFDGGNYEVYTQKSTWENESEGLWQPLVTTVGGEIYGIRDAFGAEPFFCLWNNQTQRGTAFHILANCSWKYTVSTTCGDSGIGTAVEVELGINNRNFNYTLAPGEELEFPTVIYYDIRNKIDLDCYKIHSYMNKNHAARKMPVMFNTWMYKFEHIDFENVASQIQRAAQLGIEYFVIDAGWFGQGNFWKCRGDWYENLSEAFKGRMKELSEKVRENGMKFGFWLEIESGGADSKRLAQHPEFYFKYKDMYLFDFGNPKACDYMYETICGLLEQYNAEFIKFDFNQDTRFDQDGAAFIKYFKGYRKMMEKVKQKHPELYVEHCASGGLRMTLNDSMYCDGFWLSDNHSLYQGMRIYKDTIKRMSPQSIEKWASVTSVDNFSHNYQDKNEPKTVASNDALWIDVRGVNMPYLKGFLTGSGIGFSCSLTAMSDELFQTLKNHIAEFKANREFWKNCVCHILCDTSEMLVLEYCDEEKNRIEIRVYSDIIHQTNLTVYPKVDLEAVYKIGNRTLSGREIDENGIESGINAYYSVKEITLEKLK